jgi:hypothetical protein
LRRVQDAPLIQTCKKLDALLKVVNLLAAAKLVTLDEMWFS